MTRLQCVAVNGTFTVTVTVQNTGSTSGSFDIQVADTALLGGWTINTGPQLNQSFSAGQTRSFPFTVTASSGGTHWFNGQARISGHVLWDGSSMQSGRATATDATPQVQSVSLSTNAVAVNGTFTVTVTVQNTGSTSGSFDIQVADTALLGGWTMNTGPQLNQSFSAGQYWSFPFTVTASSGGTHSFNGQARISGHVLWDGSSMQSGNVTATDATPQVQLVSLLTNAVAVNGTFTVTVTVQNTGSTSGSFDIQVADTVLLGGWTINTGPQLNQSFSAGQTRSFPFTVTASSGGTHSFNGQARISGHVLWDGSSMQSQRPDGNFPDAIF